MALTIYGTAASRAARPLWVAQELGLVYRHVALPYLGGATRTPEFLALNPIQRWSFWAVTECEKDALVVLMHGVLMPPERRKPELAQAAQRRLLAPLRVLEQHLQTRPYLAGGRFTVADVCVASVLAWIESASSLMAACPQVHAWLQRCLARPAFQAVKLMAKTA